MSAPKEKAVARQKGTGSIRERSPGHYELRVYDAATNRQVVRTYRASRPEKGAGIRAARAELAKLVAEVAEGKHRQVPQRATVAELLDRWLAQREAVGRAPTTLDDYAASCRRIKATAIGTKAVVKLTTLDIDQAYAAWRANGMTTATVIHHHRVLRAALNQAERWGWVTRNPAKYATVGNSRPPELHVPSPDQARARTLKRMFACRKGRPRSIAGERNPDVR